MSEKSKLTQGDNTVTIVGILKEHSLEVHEKDGKKSIYGNVIIKVNSGEESAEHRVSFYASELTKDNKKNKSYPGLETVIREYVSLADCANDGLDISKADTVAITSGEFIGNDYVSAAGKLVEGTKIKSSFINRAKNDAQHKATFKITGCFKSISPEIVNEEETGAQLITLVVPNYKGEVFKMKLIAEGGAGSYLADNYEVKGTSDVWGNLIMRGAVKKGEITEGFGESYEEEDYDNRRMAFLITGGRPEMYEEDDKNYLDPKLIKMALTERETYLESLKDATPKKEVKKTPTW